MHGGKSRAGVEACRDLGLDTKYLDPQFIVAYGVSEAARETLEQTVEVHCRTSVSGVLECFSTVFFRVLQQSSGCSEGGFVVPVARTGARLQ